MDKRKGRFCDERLIWQENLCFHCGTELNADNRTREHIPTKCLLREPYPEGLLTIKSCRDCNRKFSRDEEYLFAVMASVLSGSTDPEKQTDPKAGKTLESSPGLRNRIEQCKKTVVSESGETNTVFYPELERVNNVVVKNARGHVLYETERWIAGPPDQVLAVSAGKLDRQTYEEFEGISDNLMGVVTPELGTRQFMRLFGSSNLHYPGMNRQWIVVQDQVYRYEVADCGDSVLVKSVVHEYLFTEVLWSADTY